MATRSGRSAALQHVDDLVEHGLGSLCGGRASPLSSSHEPDVRAPASGLVTRRRRVELLERHHIAPEDPVAAVRDGGDLVVGVLAVPDLRDALELVRQLLRAGIVIGQHEQHFRPVGHVLTTQRYVFLGQKRTIAVELSEIIGVEPYGDAVTIHRAGKEQTEMYGDLNRQEIAYTADGQRTLISGLLVACALEGLMTRNRATSRSAPAPVTEAHPATLLTPSTADELAKLADLRDRGALTDEEFARLKAELIG